MSEDLQDDLDSDLALVSLDGPLMNPTQMSRHVPPSTEGIESLLLPLIVSDACLFT